jgi:hypothetical protein
MIAELITQHRGEYVLRIGEQPPRAQLFAEVSDDADGWSGVPRTVQELDLLKDGVTRTVEEVGGKVGEPSTPTPNRPLTGPSDFCSFRNTNRASTDIFTSEVTSTKCLSDP